MDNDQDVARNGEPADLVLEGGGVKGIGLVGAVSALFDKGYRFGDQGRIAGTSAGAVVGSLVAAGMTVPRMAEVMRELDYRRFRDGGPFGPVSRGVSLVTRMGLYKGRYLHRWVTEQLESCGVRTFGDLRLDDPGSALSREHGYKLVVVVSDVTSGHMARLPWDYWRYGLEADEQLVADAVCASAAIPFFFRPVHLKLPEDGQVAVCTDGGMLSNFPINIFDRPRGERPRWPTFGVKLSGKPPAGRWHANWAPVNGPLSLAKALVTTMANAHDRLYVDDPAVGARTIFVDTMGVKATDFSIGAGLRLELYERGRAAAAEFLADWDLEAYLDEYR